MYGTFNNVRLHIFTQKHSMKKFLLFQRQLLTFVQDY